MALLIMVLMIPWYLSKVDSSLSVLFGILGAIVLNVGTFPLSLFVGGFSHPWLLPTNLALWGALFGLIVHRKMRLATRLDGTFSLSPLNDKGSLKGFACVWAALPLLIGLVGGLIGLAYGVAALGINLKVLASSKSTRHKYVMTFLVLIVSSIAYFVTTLMTLHRLS